MKDLKFNPQAILAAVRSGLAKVKKYASVLTFLLFMGIYGFLIYEINTLSNPNVDPSEVASQSKSAPAPHIDKEAIQKLQSLNDNSVNVQTLFQQGRTNPFQE